MTIGILHPGQMGAAVAAQATAAGQRVLWCPHGRSEASAERAAAAGLEPVEGLAELLGQSDIVLSIVPPAFAEDLAAHVAASGYSGIYVEANAISPGRARRIERLLPGAHFIDGGIIGGPPTEHSSVRLYLSGAASAMRQVQSVFASTTVSVQVLDGGVGQASALKIAYGSFQKASRALAAVSHALAEHHGVGAELLAEAKQMGASALARPDHLPGVAARAWRWGPEMREGAATLAEAGLPADLAAAAAQVFQRWDGDKDAWGLSLSEVLAHLSAAEGSEVTDRQDGSTAF
jgi:3-hydroxyisobutyrate dehydrogenase-like beta-hydroxyacid dehydrogenase